MIGWKVEEMRSLINARIENGLYRIELVVVRWMAIEGIEDPTLELHAIHHVIDTTISNKIQDVQALIKCRSEFEWFKYKTKGR